MSSSYILMIWNILWAAIIQAAFSFATVARCDHMTTISHCVHTSKLGVQNTDPLLVSLFTLALVSATETFWDVVRHKCAKHSNHIASYLTRLCVLAIVLFPQEQAVDDFDASWTLNTKVHATGVCLLIAIPCVTHVVNLRVNDTQFDRLTLSISVWLFGVLSSLTTLICVTTKSFTALYVAELVLMTSPIAYGLYLYKRQNRKVNHTSSGSCAHDALCHAEQVGAVPEPHLHSGD